MSHLDYDVFSNNDMVYIVQFMWDVLRKGGHKHIFCSELQFGMWYKPCRTLMGTEADSGLQEHTEAVKITVSVFEEEKVALKYNRVAVYYTPGITIIF